MRLCSSGEPTAAAERWAACSYNAMCDYMADVRLPGVADSLWVVLANRGDRSAALSEQDLRALEAMPASCDASGSPRAHPLAIGAAEVVAIYSLMPPAPPPPKAGQARDVIASVRRKLKAWSHRLAWLLPLARFGPLVPLRALWWMSDLIRAVEAGDRLPIQNAGFHNLQTMCVAKHLQGQGVGTAVIAMAQEQARGIAGFKGMKGLCQSEQTRRFYERQGFQTVAVLSHAHGWRAPGSIRTHWLVAWSLQLRKDAFRAETRNAGFGCGDRS